jgi:hypothetical protein
VSWPVLEAVLGFVVNVNTTLPFPFPVLPDVILIQSVLVEAVHAQVAGEETATDAEPLPEATV